MLATAGSGSDRTQEVSYTDAKVIGNGSFGVVYQAKLVESNELVAIKKVLQDKRFKVSILNSYDSLLIIICIILACFAQIWDGYFLCNTDFTITLN